MWVFLNDAFFSVVKDENSDMMKVRSRVTGDLERHFPNHPVIETPYNDYRYRIYATREEVAYVLSNSVYDIEYTNFKDSVKDPERGRSYMKVWNVMFHLQALLHFNNKKKR